MGFSLVFAQAKETDSKTNPNTQGQNGAKPSGNHPNVAGVPASGEDSPKPNVQRVPEARQFPETTSYTGLIVSMTLFVLLAITVLG